MNQKEKAEAIKRQLVIINKLLKKPENKYCADCKRTSPSWASINLGVFVCINCSGCHREIGVHVTKIKSVNLDVWAEDTLKYFQKINNEIANEYWEHKLKNFDFKSIQNDNYKLIKFIRDKYEYKKWVNKKKKDPMTLIMQGKFKNKKKSKKVMRKKMMKIKMKIMKALMIMKKKKIMKKMKMKMIIKKKNLKKFKKMI